jgi:hypothetical protein
MGAGLLSVWCYQPRGSGADSPDPALRRWSGEGQPSGRNFHGPHRLHHRRRRLPNNTTIMLKCLRTTLAPAVPSRLKDLTSVTVAA